MLAVSLFLSGCACLSHCPACRKHGGNKEGKARIEGEVRQAQEQFLVALHAMFGGDMGPMTEVWSHGEDVTVMTPFGGRYVGWGAVREQLTRESHMGMSGHLACHDELVRVGDHGDLAYTVCNVVGEDFKKQGQPLSINLRATSIWRREGRQWKLVHHHIDALPEAK